MLAVAIGEAFGVPLGDGRFGLCRVIGPGPASEARRIFVRGAAARAAVLVLATRWIGTRAQLARALRDKRARQPLVLTHHTWKRKPYVILVTTQPPADFVRVGVLAPTPSEARLKNVYFAWESLAQQYLAQLEWETDEAGVRERDRRAARQRQAELQRERDANKQRRAAAARARRARQAV